MMLLWGTPSNKGTLVSAGLEKLMDFALYAPSVLAARLAERLFRNPLNSSRFPLSTRAWDDASILPVPYHYYQPILRPTELPEDFWRTPDPLLGIDLHVTEQLALLDHFAQFAPELAAIPEEPSADELAFFYNNPNFGSGDAEALYCLLRLRRPRTIIEIGSGYSTRLARLALDRNAAEGAPGRIICVEPYEMPWLTQIGVDELIRRPVQDVGMDVAGLLTETDVLFIDSSHVVRTGGDVNHIFRRMIPAVPRGVLVHVHDIFLPFEYPVPWMRDLHRFFTEQYLLQAFMAFNDSFRTVLALSYLASNHHEALSAACPVFARQSGRIPGSFWAERVT